MIFRSLLAANKTKLLIPLLVKMRSFFLLSLLVAAASAFVAPANKAVGKIFFSGEDLQLISLGIFDVERCWREQYYCQFGLLIDSLLA